MSSSTYGQQLKMNATIGISKPHCAELLTGNCKLTTAFTAAALANDTAAAAAERFAAFMPFQWH